MASALNSVYVIVVTLVALGGVLFVASISTERSTPRWVNWGSILIALLFVLLLGVQFLVL